MLTRKIAHLDMDAFFAAVEQRDNPSLKGKPVVIGADPKGGQGRGVVSTCSYEARPFGIHSAMPITRAYRLCPHAVYLRGNSRKYRHASNQIFDILKNYTPDIQPISIDEAFMDISGCFHGSETATDLCCRIKDHIKREVQLNASIGIAPNKMIAKIASDYCKPDGLLEIKPEDMLNFLWPLPIGKIWGVGAKTQEALVAMNINNVGDLAKYPVDKLHARFGEYGIKLSKLANGIDERPVEDDDEVKSVSNEHTFDTDTRNLDEIYDKLLFLSQKVARRLRRHGLKGKTIGIKIRTADFRTITRAHTIGQRIHFDDIIYKEVKQMFEANYKPNTRIRLIGVRVSNFEDPYVQESLFESPEDSKRESMYKAIDQIKDKYGEKAIKSGHVKTHENKEVRDRNL